MSFRIIVAALLVWLAPMGWAAGPSVVINEIFYNAPGDMDDVQWVELHNVTEGAADLSGWTLNEGNLYAFAAGTSIDGGGYLVVALSPQAISRVYGVTAVGPLKRAIKKGGEALELRDGAKKVVDAAKFDDRAPWPVSADGESASLERITPGAAGDVAENWAGSVLPASVPAPAGTPGRQNTAYSAVLPPVISVGAVPHVVGSEKPLTVVAEVKDARAVRDVTLLYKTLTKTEESKDFVVPMKRGEDGKWTAEIPGQAVGTLIRYRVTAVNDGEARRFYPGANDLRPTLSTYVNDRWDVGKIGLGMLILSDRDRINAAGAGWGGGSPNARGGGSVDPPPSARPRTKPKVEPVPGGAQATPAGTPRPTREAAPPAVRRPAVVYQDGGTVRAPRGGSAFVYVDPQGKATLFDYVHALARRGGRGYKVYFHKDHLFNGMSAVNVVYEGSEWSLMAEALAYDVYRRAGNAAPLTDFLRMTVDGKLLGYYLVVERPNRQFLRRNKLNDEGNLYKINWMSRDVASMHEKKTNEREGHEDVVELVQQLRQTKADPQRQWKLIQERFDVPQVATYFAMNMVLSHWDGYFNNYYTYHDAKGTKKWQMYPWDQDKTSGFYDGIGDDQVFFDMPLTFGMDGDRPPSPKQRGGFGALFGGDNGGGGGGPFGGGAHAPWWRGPGVFSGPLLSNAEFRKVFLARVKKIVEEVYTEEYYGKFIDGMAAKLEPEVRLRAKLRGEPEEAGARLLAHNAEMLKMHLKKRREWLLSQKELQPGVGAERGE